MKISLILVLSFFSLSAIASFNEVECWGSLAGKEVHYEIERPWPEGSYFRRSTLKVVENGKESRFVRTVTARPAHAFYEVQYRGAGINLVVNHWPDQRPRWARQYRAKFISSFTSSDLVNLTCEFPNAF